MKALITGITGQDGSYLSEFLEKKGYEVYGLERRVAMEDQNLRHREGIKGKIIPCEISNYGSVFSAIEQVKPDEIYHLAAQSDVGYSFKDPFQTFQTNIDGTLNVLESMRKIVPKARMYFAASSEMFGEVLETPQTEKTPFNPRSPYGISKVAGFYLCKNYREAYNMHISCGICFNHESPRRGKEFVTRKITSGIKKILDGKERKIKMGNLDAKRDWGFAGDYVEAMWLMLQQDKPDDYVIATGETHSIKEFIQEAFHVANQKLYKENRIGDELPLIWQDYIEVDPNFIRPSDVNLLIGDASKAKRVLNWEPKTKFKDLIKLMMEEEK